MAVIEINFLFTTDAFFVTDLLKYATTFTDNAYIVLYFVDKKMIAIVKSLLKNPQRGIRAGHNPNAWLCITTLTILAYPILTWSCENFVWNGVNWVSSSRLQNLEPYNLRPQVSRHCTQWILQRNNTCCMQEGDCGFIALRG